MKFGVSWMLAALLLAAGCGSQQDSGVVQREGQPDYVRSFDEQAMEKAIHDARSSWQQFSRALMNPSDRMSGFSIKRGFRVGDDPEAEHIWLTDVSFDGSRFTGRINNEPVDTREVKFGDIVEVAPEQLSDWMYIENGVLRGGFTIRVLVKQRTPEEQAQFFERAGFRIE
ncbi:MAG TPA: DUF2314 domain-containing protein [Gammaproteobacteria bacterium]